MDGKEILHGIRIGRHDFHPEEVMEWIDKNVIAYGLNFLRFNVRELINASTEAQK